jgi:malonyl-CoA/methylmalonyl-CoA synthetase
VRGDNVFGAYWRLPAQSAAAFSADGYFRTGDQGRFDADGYLAIVGRSKDLIISGGLNVYPREIEHEIEELPGVAEAAVFGVPHADFGEAVVAAVVLAAGGMFDQDGAQAHLRRRLAGYKLPKRLLVVEDLPRNTLGKVQKNRLREDYRDLFVDAATHHDSL